MNRSGVPRTGISRTGISLSVVLPALVLIVVVGVVGYVVFAKDQLPGGPTDLVWDRTACAACQMHVGEPGFAAQVQLRDGSTLAFDDPGCLFELLPGLTGDVHAVWFHHLREERWLRSDSVAFVAVSPTPMGFGIGAVDPGTPGSFSLDAARAHVAQAAQGNR